MTMSKRPDLKLFYILFFLFSTLFIFAEKVEVESDAMHTESVKKEVHFVGNAKVKKEQDWIHADTIIVTFNENNETKKYKAIGKVNFEFKNEKAHYIGKANTAEYFPLKSLYILTGKAKVDDLLNKRSVKGDKITVDMIAGDSKVEGSEKKPVKFIFEMKDEK